MQHGAVDRLGHHGGLMHKALLAMAAAFGALVVSWIAYLMLVGAFLLWG